MKSFGAVASCALVPFFLDPIFERDEPISPPWWIENNLQASRLYHNGDFVSSESGTNDLGLSHYLDSGIGVKIGIMDVDNAHADRVIELAGLLGSEVMFCSGQREGSGTFSSCLPALLDLGCKVIVVPWGWSDFSETASNVCRSASNIVIVCSVPNQEINLDTVSDYPGSWAGMMRHVLPISSTDRNGQHYSPSAIGTNVIGAPGRNIVAAGTYSSGTSYAAPIAGACIGALSSRNPTLNANQLVADIRETATPEGLIRRINPVAAFRKYETSFTLIMEQADYLNGGWNPVATNTITTRSPSGFFRIRIGE